MSTTMMNKTAVMTSEKSESVIEKGSLPTPSRDYIASYDIFSATEFESRLLDPNTPREECQMKGLYIKKYADYTLFSYNKEQLTIDNTDTLGLFRSVIFYKDKMVSFAPPKTITLTKPENQEVLTQLKDTNFQFAEDFVEGTHISVFYVGDGQGLEGDNGWVISSRKVINAKTSFFQNGMTFRDMFKEAMQHTHLTFDKLNPNYCYSFILKHPKNRMVCPTPYPTLFLAAVYHIKGMIANEIDVHNDAEISTMFRNTAIGAPYRYTYELKGLTEASSESTYSLDTIQQFTQNLHEYYQGTVIRDGNKTYKLRNEKYDHIRKFRGNQSKMQYHYYCLRQADRLIEFQSYFPEFKQQFETYENELNVFINNLYQHYVSRFIRKDSKDMKDYPFEYRNHMWKLHEQYLMSFRTVKQSINPYIVARYVSSLEPAKLMHSVNFCKRPPRLIINENDNDNNNIVEMDTSSD
jgi:hypothetical protein